jgi:hypothetical protein
MSSSGLAARMVKMQLLGPFCPFFVFINVSAYSPEAKNSFHYILNSAPFDVFMLIISFTVSPARSLETTTTLVTSCGFIFARMCLFVYVSASKKS